MRKTMLALVAVALVVSACASSETKARGKEGVLRLGIFPNLTHAPGYVALEAGILEDVLAPTEVELTYFNSGSDAGTAILSGSIDATYIGPGPATSLYLQSEGKVAIVSGAAAGGRRSLSARVPASSRRTIWLVRDSRFPGLATPRTSPSDPGCTSRD